MSNLPELYQELILDHGRHPRGTHLPGHANCVADGHNPLCGDRVRVHVRKEGDVVVDVGFEGAGCAICTAAASTMTEAVRGKRVDEIRALSRTFRELVTGKRDAASAPQLGKLEAFAGVSAFPMRVKCATLAWHTLEAALDGEQPASSEPVEVT